MKHLKNVLIIILIATLTLACSSDDDNIIIPTQNTEELLIANWRLISGTNPFGGAYQSDNSTCEDIFFNYKSNNTLDLILRIDTENDGNCTEGVALSSTWSLNNLTLSFTNEGITETINIISISNTELRLKSTEAGSIEQFYNKAE